MARPLPDLLVYFLSDCTAGISGLSVRSMFGGYGIYRSAMIFGIYADGSIYFKVDETNRADFEAYGSHPFVYGGKGGKITTLSYWLLPDAIFEDRERLAEWIDRSASIASRRRK